METIGLFPLPIVLLPFEQIPLHIFEPRYKELIGECLAQDAAFGLVLSNDDGLREVGTAARVLEVLERFPDGRLNVVIEGVERFRLLEVTEGRSFATARVEPLEDEDDPPASDDVEECLAAFGSLAEAAGYEGEFTAEGGDLGFRLAGRVELGAAAKQELLELRSERARLRRVAALFREAARAARWQKELRERASRNGRVEPPG